MDNDIIRNVGCARTVMQHLSDDMLIDLGCTIHSKHQTFIPKESDMSDERCNWPRILMELKLMKTEAEVELKKILCSGLIPPTPHLRSEWDDVPVLWPR